uniref:Uncharacterized protein n=1 Tax=Aplanochytrium stocchinoi TaxID=215587 RepID=A0A7S3LPJ6_9STRA
MVTISDLHLFSYHTYNAIGSAIDPDFDISENRGICIAGGVGATIGVPMNLFGLFIVAYSLRTTVRQVLVKKINISKEVLTNSFLLKGCVVAVGLGVLLYLLDRNNLDSFRGLYCSFAAWNLRNGLILIAYVSATMGLIFYFFADSYFILKQHAFMSATDERITKVGDFEKKVLRFTVTLTIKFFVVFLFFWYVN